MQTNTSRPSLYLVDGTAYVYRAFHAIRGLHNSRGVPTNAVYGFTRMIQKLIAEKKPDRLAIVFDAPGPTFRHERYSDYKANRPPMPEELVAQLPLIDAVVKGYCLPLLQISGFEADDVIGTLARCGEAAGYDVVMVTGDKDFKQLVTAHSVIWDPMKERTIDPAAIEAESGLTPGQIIDVMGLSGDSADNVPGVAGVGPKTAIRLIAEHADMDGVYAAIEKVKGPKLREKLEKSKPLAYLSRELVTIRTDVPLTVAPGQLTIGEPDREALATLFQDLGFRQLHSEVSQQVQRKQKKYHVVYKDSELKALIQRLEGSERFALDTETTATDPMRARLVGLSFALKTDEAYYIPCAHAYPNVPEQLDLTTVLAQLRPVLENAAIGKIGQNIKYDWLVLSRHGIELKGIAFDTMLASYLIQPISRAHNLDQIALDYLGHKTITFAEVAGKGKNALRFDQVPIEHAVPYACEDADITLAAAEILEPLVKEQGLSQLMQDVELPLVGVLKRIEQVGMCVDTEALRSLSKEFAKQLQSIENDIYTAAGEFFNINSPKQLGVILFEKLGLPVQKKTRKKTGYSTDVEVLTKLAADHELPALILRHRSLTKLKSTYTDALLEMIHPETGRIHTSFNQTVAATGRLSSSDPNLQNIPIRTEEGRRIRQAFIPRPGWHLLSADYSQIELRILAHISEDPLLIEAFLRDKDIHAQTAAEVFQVFPEMINDELRRRAKAVNFGIIYGISAFGLAKQLGISRAMAQTTIKHYFARYKGVRKYMDQVVEQARQTKMVTTLLGRTRPLPDIDAANRNVREFAQRTAINTPIQGSAADLIKMAMIHIDAKLRHSGMQTTMLLSVHDEIVFETPPEELEQAQQLVVAEMESVFSLRVPLKVNAAVGANWDEAH